MITGRLPFNGQTPSDVIAAMLARLGVEYAALVPGGHVVMVAGWPLYGDPPLLDALGVRWRPVTVDGAARGLEAELARRATGLVRGHPALAAVRWLGGLVFD